MGEYTEIGKYALAMASILNPIGAIPVFLAMTKELDDSHRLHMVKSSAIAVFITLTVSLVLGQKILNAFGISVASFTIGGGILIFTMALNMIKARTVAAKLNKDEITESSLKEIGIVPLAIPLLSGPGAISTSIIYAKNFQGPIDWSLAILTLFLCTIFIYFVLAKATVIKKRFGELGVNVLTRVMGLILLAMAIEMMLGGVKEIIPILKG